MAMPIKHSLTGLIAVLARSLSIAQRPSGSDMGPAAFLWPEDRPWCPHADNIPPCGSTNGVGKRTEFPLTNGRLALVAQEETHAVHVGVSYSNDPQSLSNFEIFDDPSKVHLKPGHTCLWTPDAPSNIESGDNATFFMLYVPNESPEEAYYACTDVTFVSAAEFKADGVNMHCFNATRGEPKDVSK